MRKRLSILVLVSLVASLIVSAVAPPVVMATPDWLSGYAYRKQIAIIGSTAGIQTDYQMQLEVYKKAVPIATTGKYPLHPTILSPQAYYYNGKTYVVWQGGSNFDPYIDCYTHATGTWSGAVKIGTNPLTDDTHGGPIVIVDNSGYIHVFFGSHNTAREYYKSTSTEDISAWSVQTDIGSATTYGSIVKDGSGVLWLFMRELVSGANHEYYRKSTDWTTSFQVIVADVGDSIYIGNAEYESTNGRIHIAWSYYDASETKRLNIYHAYLKLSDGHMYSMDGTDLGTSISRVESDAECLIADSGANKYQTNSPTLHLDSNNYPFIIYNIDSATSYHHTFIKWNGTSWDAAQAITSSSHQAAYADFIINTATSIDAYLTISAGTSESGDLEKWHWNGSSWSKTKTILAETDAHYDGVNCANIVVDGVAALRAIFCEVYVAGYLTTYDLHIYAINSDDKFLDYAGRVELGDNCQDDFDDIRFTTSDELTELGYWRESYTSADMAVFYVKFDSIAASPSTTDFYIYYSNSVASSASDADNTFIEFKDWEYNVDDWIEDTTAGTEAERSRSILAKYTGTYAFRHQCPTVGQGGHYKVSSLSANKQLEFWIRVSGSDQIIALQDQAAYTGAHIFTYLHFQPDNSIQTHDGSSFHDTGATWVAGAWYRVKISNITFSASYAFDIDVYDTDGIWLGGLQDTGSYADINSITHINVQDSGNSYSNDSFLDAYRIRNYCDPEPTWGTWSSAESSAPPVIVASSATTITTTTATLNGYVADVGGGNCTVTVYWGDNDGGTIPSSWDNNSVPTSPSQPQGEASFYKDITGLSPGTLYYFNAAGINDYGTGWGTTKSFTTATGGGIPIVTTGSAVGVTANYAVLQASLSSLGDFSPVYVYFQYGLTTSYGATTAEQTKTATGGFNQAISGLVSNTAYHFRAVGRYGASGYVYGGDAIFTTIEPGGEPGVDPPDILRIDDIKVFSGYDEEGDQLYVIDYRIIYTAGTPALDVGDYFDFVLLDGDVIRAKLPVRSWGYRPGSIYLTVDSALLWQGAYTVKIIGNPNKWDTPPSCEQELSSGDWQGDDLSQLEAWVIALATSLQSYYEVELVTYAQGIACLTDQGTVIFNMGIPGLCGVIPHLCSSYVWYPTRDMEDRDIPVIDTEERAGTEIYEASSDVAAFFGLSDVNIPIGLAFGGGFFVVAILLTVVLGSRMGQASALAGVGIASPILIYGAWLGFVPMPLIIIIAAICAVYTVFAVWVKGV